MTDKPKPLTKAEWEHGQPSNISEQAWQNRIDATLDALFRYRDRTRGFVISTLSASYYTDDIAAEEGIE